jgi:hypothetical protein
MSDHSAALCIRLDIDTFSTRQDFIAKVGTGEYAYIPKILQTAERFGARLQFCACGEGLLECPQDVRSIQDAGHAVDSHLHTHRVTLRDTVRDIEGELVAAEAAFRREGIVWNGIGTTGMYPQGIDDRADVHLLLERRGYRWCSSKFNVGLPLEAMQPYWLTGDLLEIPCAGWSDMGWWYYADLKPVHPQNEMGTVTLDGFISHGLSHLHRANEGGLLYAIVLHPGALSKHDPDCRLISALLSEARRLNMPVWTMGDIRKRDLATHEANAR